MGIVPAGESSPSHSGDESAVGDASVPPCVADSAENPDAIRRRQNLWQLLEYSAQHRDGGRERLLGELLFAAKDLAESQIEPEDSGEPAFCMSV